MFAVTWINDLGGLESITTPSRRRAKVVAAALSVFFRSVRTWQGNTLV